jgi:histidine phosphotransfer protein HptB
MPELNADARRVYSRHAADPDYSDLLAMFAASLAEKDEAFRSAFARGDLRELQILAHQTKGAGGGYGFDGLSSRAAELEQACKAGRLEAIAAALDELIAYMGRISA